MLVAAALSLPLITLGLDTAMAIVALATRSDALQGLGVVELSAVSFVSASGVVLALIAYGRELPAG